jgi:hypothetical protein
LVSGLILTFKIRFIRIFTRVTDGLNSERLVEALTLLGERLRHVGVEPLELVVCGGSSLIAAGFVSRATRDVDVLALRVRGEDVISARPLPPALLEAATRVAADLGMPDGWLNNGPADLFEMGLPEKFASRLQRRAFGSHLTIWFAGRLDLIHFKLYAAADQGPGRHVDDLIALNPSGEELAAAAQWAFTHDVSPGFRSLMRELLTQLGHDDVARKI